MRKIIKFLKSLFKRVNELFYVGSSNILPPPLKREDELFHLKRNEQGDIESKNILIEHNLRLVVYLAKKYENTMYDLEDLVSIGSIGLIKGVNTYKLDKNIKLATYASRCIDNEILMFLRKNKKRRGEISFEDSLSYDGDGNELHLEDVLGTEPDIVTKPLDKAVEKELMLQELEKLEAREREIMIMRYGLLGVKEMTQKEVAKELNISQSYISRIEKKVIKRLKSIVNV